MKTPAILPIILLGILLTSCSEKEKTNVKADIRGEWTSERHYLNEYFNLEVTIPEEWTFNKGPNEHLATAATDLFAGDDQNLKNTLKSAIDKTYSIFGAYRYPPGTPGKTNPNVTSLIENIVLFPGVQSASDYLLAAEDTLKMTTAKVEFLTEPEVIELNGLEITKREQRLPMGNLAIRQTFYCIKKEEYVLIFAASFIGEEDEKITQELTDTIRAIGYTAPSVN